MYLEGSGSKEKQINFLDRIKSKALLLKPGHPDKIEVFDGTWKFYLVDIANIRYILGIRKTSDTQYQKVRYFLNGFVLGNVTDCLFQDKGKWMVSKSEGNTKYFISNGLVLYKHQKLEFLPIDKKVTQSKGIENPNIGVIDTETYQTSNGSYEIYCLGFKTNLAQEPVIYYVTSNYDETTRKVKYNSNKIVLDLINELLKPKYDKTNFYFFLRKRKKKRKRRI